MRKELKRKKRNYQRYISSGITLVNLVITIVILLILLGITITYVMRDNGVLEKVYDAKLQIEIAEAREQLEVTFGHAKILKYSDKEYNQDKYLDELMKKEILGIKIEDNIVIINEYVFEIDRSVPKIEKYVGKEASKLLSPKVKVSTTTAEDRKTATITIIAKEEKNGIDKIQVIEEGYVINEYTYKNIKTEITEDVVVKENGKYTIKVYGNLTSIEKIEIKDLIPSIKFIPNGSIEYKKEHTVALNTEYLTDKVRNIKYQWLETVEEPEKDTFVEEVRNGLTIKKDGITGTWYLWILVETELGKINVTRSEGFNFDNQAPIVTLECTPMSETSFTLKVMGQDNQSKIAKYEIYVENKKEAEIETEEEEKSFTINVDAMKEYETYVLITDNAGNVARKNLKARTLMYTWEKWLTNEDTTYQEEVVDSLTVTANIYYERDKWPNWASCTLDSSTGVYKLSQSCCVHLYYDGYDYENRCVLDPNLYTYSTFDPRLPNNATSSFVWKVTDVKKGYASNGYRDVSLTFSKYEIKTSVDRTQGNTFLEYSYSADENTFSDGFNSNDGYWYVSVGIQ